MAKEVFTIKDFSGGLNTDKADSAIEDNELVECTNLDPTSKGKVVRSRHFLQDNANYTDQTATTVQPGLGLFAFANDNKVSDKAAYTGEFIAKSDGGSAGTAEIDILEPASTWTTNQITDQAIYPQFYAAEGDLFCGGDHSTTPAALIYHEHDKFKPALATGYSTPDWATSVTQAKTKPTNTTDMRIGESSGVGITGLGANKLDWIIKYGADGDGLWTNDISKAEGVGGYYEFGGSWLYKNDAESPIEDLNTGSDNDSPMVGNTTNTLAPVEIQAYVSAVATSAGNAHYGAKLYVRENKETEWYLLITMSYDKGIKVEAQSDWQEWENATSSFDHNTDGFQATSGVISAPPNLMTFKNQNGYDMGDIPTDNLVYWKVAVIANSRAYVGNVKIGQKVFGDKILKSPIFQYDVFTPNNFIEVAINDGDQITALAGFGDNILEFKENAVYIINVSQEFEFLEHELQGAGVFHQAAVANTPMGVVWVNQTGCFFYDGNEISQLQTGKISQTEWNDNIEETAIIGYDHIKQQIIIAWKSTNAGADDQYGYIFNAGSGTWYHVNDLFGTAATMPANVSNMVNARGNNLIVAGGSHVNDILTLSTRTITTNAVFLTTKSFDFGNPESKKNLLEVAVSYANGTTGEALMITVSTEHSTNFVATGGYLSSTASTQAVTEADTSAIADLQGKKTFQVRITGTAQVDFELYSITLTYRDLGVH